MLYNSITNNTFSVVNDFTYAIKIKAESTTSFGKNKYNYYFDETASLAIQYSFQFNNRREFDLRRGDFSEKRFRFSFDNHAVNLIIKNHYMTGISKRSQCILSE
jgi:iron complex outermembrane receptor protein